MKDVVAFRASRSDRDAEVGQIDDSPASLRFDDEASAALNLMKNLAAQSSKYRGI